MEMDYGIVQILEQQMKVDFQLYQPAGFLIKNHLLVWDIKEFGG
jgi:hypothetical protein